MSTMQDPEAGSQVGPYRLRRVLGRGGTGAVYEAEDTDNERVVALKLLPLSLSSDPAYRKRLQREVDAVRQVDDPHVVPINNVGEIDGRLYIDMRFIDGADLGTILQRQGSISPSRATGVLRQIASALDTAHGVGLLHRDVKPANILMTPDDDAYLADFGIARGADDDRITALGSPIGTYAYMAPERFASDTVDHLADVYSLACVLYECLTGRPPFPGDSIEPLIAAHLMQPPPRPSETSPMIPAEWDQVIAQGMAKNPAQRYESAGALAQAAQAVASQDVVAEAGDGVSVKNIATSSPGPRPHEITVYPDVRIGPPPPPAGLAGFHDDARISVWRPLSLRVGYWSSLLVSVHTSEAPPGVHEREHPLRVLRRRAKAILGEQLPTYSLLSADSTLGVVEESEITLLVDLPNFDVPRGRRNFLWLNAFHMEEFHVRPSYDSDGLVTRGKVLCFHGTDLLSEITLAIRVRTDTTGDTGW